MLTLLAALVAQTTFALVPLPREGHSACYQQRYSEEHMKRNPQQALAELHIWMHRPKQEEGDYPGAQVIGLRKGEWFANTMPVCGFEPGRVECISECDGGSFSLRSAERGMEFQVEKDSYLPLYRDQTDPGNPREDDVLPLKGSDPANNFHELTLVPESECEKALSRIRDGGMSCFKDWFSFVR